MAVVLIISLLTAITVGVGGYIQRRTAIATTRAQIAAIETALESYKSDWGYYPPTMPARISASGLWESTNNFLLYSALCPTNVGRKTYLNPSQMQVRTNTFSQQPNFYDGWAHPFNYYNSPAIVYQVASGYTLGGQVNATTYDLFSYGQDGYTYAVTNAGLPAGWVAQWLNRNSATDDITNWGK